MDSKNRNTTALIARRCKPILSQLKICCQDHGRSCNGDVLGLGEDDVEINLIDVRRMCLVQRNSATCGYFTLSYVWGGVEQHCLSKSNLDFLRQEGSFNAIMQHIPQVARDAIQLVRGLKGNYLWIDSLCIVQDDAEQKHHQIAHMAQIYSRSFLTIVAAEALNANSGLPCAHYTDLTLSKTYPGMEAPVDDNDLEQVLRSSKFGSRAWTYQEILLSRRRLFSYTNRTVLQCGTGSWYSGLSDEWELNPIDAEMPLFPLPRLAMASGWSWLLSYQWIVESYSCKDISFVSDVWPAFSGIESALASLWNCNFYQGLPARFLRFALLWSAHPGTPPLKRRSSDPKFASWSWMGWTGRASFQVFWGDASQNYQSRVLLAKAMVVVSQERSEKFDYLAYPGGNSLLKSYGSIFLQEINDGMRLSHSLSPGTKINLQFYALATPVGFLGKGTNQTHDERLIWLSVDGSTCEKITVSDHQQKAMGTLDSFDLEDLGDFTLIEKHFDIIALSVCYLGHDDCLLEDILVDVMLIQWFGENAERVAIGQVNAQAWERCHRSAKWIRLE